MKSRIARWATTAVLTGGLGLAGLGLGAGIANAGGPYQWCPGQDRGGFGGAFNTPGPPNWDWGVCHTYYIVPMGQGNVSPSIWADSAPPPPAPQPWTPLPGL
jgi:hypothetical protein